MSKAIEIQGEAKEEDEEDEEEEGDHVSN